MLIYSIIMKQTLLIITPLQYYSKNTFCRYLIDASAFAMSVLLPILFIMIFGLMTIFNIRRSHRRVHALVAFYVRNSTIRPTVSLSGTVQQNHQEVKQKKKTNRHLLKMLLIQAILLTLFTLPLILERIYSMFIRPRKSPWEAAIYTVVNNIALLLNYLTNRVPFYIYTLFGGSVFRKALFDLFRIIGRKFR